jgi:SAM-dependent methyltransferase
MTDPIDVQEIMREIRARILNRAAPLDPGQNSVPALPAPDEPDWTRLEEAGATLESTHSLTGQLPPEPPTLRGRVGAFLVRIVRRALFWYTAQIIEFNGVATRSFNELLAALKTVAAAGRQSWTALDALNRQVAELQAEAERLEKRLRARREEIQTIVKTELLPEILARQMVEDRLEDATRRLEGLAQAADAETGARNELASRVDAEVATREELTRRVDTAIAAHAALAEALGAETEAREELASRVDVEVATREGLARRVETQIAAHAALAEALAAETEGRKELASRVDVEVATREGLAQSLGAETGAREELGRRVDAEVAAREGLAQSLGAETGAREELGRHVDAEIAAHAALAQAFGAEVGAREELVRRFDAEVAARAAFAQELSAEMGAREELARRVDADVAARAAFAQGLSAEMGAREELARRVDADVAVRAALAQGLSAEMGAREELARRVDAEVAARAALAQGLSAEMGAREELARRVGVEVAAREGLAQSLAAEYGAREELARRVDAEIAAREALANHVVAVSDHAGSLEADFRQSDIRLLQLRAEVINQNRRVSILLEEARKRLPAPFDEKQLVAITDEQKHALDAVYVSFEDMFRGTRAEIKDRARVYLPFLQERKIGTKRMPILDVACGRGEWLELLRENKLEARGIDINRVLLEYCTEAGLNVAEDDILQHLKNQPDRSLGAVTGFHIIEHLPFDTVVRVFDETVRVLKPGGIAIFETPNPQNVLVGSHNFYLDLTHRNPLPSLAIQFFLEARGLCDVQVLNLHPYPEAAKLRDDGTELARRFNEYFYGPQDYAVIGRKA